MICNKCKKRVATVRVTRTVYNGATEVYLCEGCAREEAMSKAQPTMGVWNMVPGFFTSGGVHGGYAAWPKAEAAKCSQCGKAFYEIRNDGKLGCSICYTDFQAKLKPIIEGIYGSASHKGRYPKDMAEKYKALEEGREIDGLKALLKKAVEDEEYEKAAEIRDSIRKLELGKVLGK